MNQSNGKPWKAAPMRGNTRAPFLIVDDSGESVDLLIHARTAALRNLPETSAVDPNQAEQAAIHQFEHDDRSAATHAGEALARLSAELDALERDFPRSRDLRLVVKQIEARVEEDLVRDRALPDLCHGEQLAHLTHRNFVRENGVTHEAQYPDSRWFHLALVGVVLLVEASLNAHFFAETSRDGLLGGYLVAVALAALNVVSGYLAGDILLRAMRHRTKVGRLLARVGLGVYVLVAITANLIVAGWRDRAIGSDSATGPVPLSAESSILLAVGLLASAISVIEGFRSDDRTPGHGRSHRRLVAAHRSYLEAQGQLLERLLVHVRSIPDGCREVLRRGEDSLKESGRIRAQALEFIEGYDAERRDLEARCELTLRAYRTENRSIRTTPAPRYFNHFPALTPSSLDRSLPARCERIIASATSQLDSLRDEATLIESGNRERLSTVAKRFSLHVERVAELVRDANETVGTFDLAPLHPRDRDGGR